MVRLAELQESDRENMLRKVPALPRFPTQYWARGPRLSQRRVAIVSTSAVIVRSAPVAWIAG